MEIAAERPGVSLNLGALLLETAGELRSRWRALLRLAALPLLVALPTVLVAAPEVDGGAAPSQLIAPLLVSLWQSAAFAVYACSVHRAILTAGDARPALGRREIRFVGWFFAIGFLVSVVFLGMALVLALVAGVASKPLLELEGVDSTLLGFVSMGILLLPVGYGFARISLVLPAAALGLRTSLGGAWRLSDGNGWRLAVLLVVAPWLVSLAVALVLSAIVPEGAPARAMGLVVLFAAGAFGVAVLSVGFRALTADAGRGLEAARQ